MRRGSSRAHHDAQSSPARIVVGAHNSHVGDARATEIAARGEVNIGQLVRERHPGDCRLLGFTTYAGTVTAASDWDGPAERKWVRPALPDSIEELLHEAGEREFLLPIGAAPRSADALRSARLERAIGVINRPQTERQSHYFRACVADQHDAVIHVDETQAVEPLERTAPVGPGRGTRGLPVRGLMMAVPEPAIRHRSEEAMKLAERSLQVSAGDAMLDADLVKPGQPGRRGAVRARQRQQPPQPAQRLRGRRTAARRADHSPGRPAHPGR